MVWIFNAVWCKSVYARVESSDKVQLGFSFLVRIVEHVKNVKGSKMYQSLCHFSEKTNMFVNINDSGCLHFNDYQFVLLWLCYPHSACISYIEEDNLHLISQCNIVHLHPLTHIHTHTHHEKFTMSFKSHKTQRFPVSRISAIVPDRHQKQVSVCFCITCLSTI